MPDPSYRKQTRNRHSGALSEQLKGRQGDVSFLPLHRADISAMQSALVGKLVLRHAGLIPVGPEIFREDRPEIQFSHGPGLTLADDKATDSE